MSNPISRRNASPAASAFDFDVVTDDPADLAARLRRLAAPPAAANPLPRPDAEKHQGQASADTTPAGGGINKSAI